MGKMRQIVFDCERAPALARFWALVLDGYAVRRYDDEEIERLAGLGLTPDTDPVVMVGGPGPELCFQQVPEPKTTKNRVHLEVYTADRTGEVQRLRDIGASVYEEYEGRTVMQDPEGNEFCIVDAS